MGGGHVKPRLPLQCKPGRGGSGRTGCSVLPSALTFTGPQVPSARGAAAGQLLRCFVSSVTTLLPLPPHAQARKYVPEELPLVSLFGWTLGGFYLARYSGGLMGFLFIAGIVVWFTFDFIGR